MMEYKVFKSGVYYGQAKVRKTTTNHPELTETGSHHHQNVPTQNVTEYSARSKLP